MIRDLKAKAVSILSSTIKANITNQMQNTVGMETEKMIGTEITIIIVRIDTTTGKILICIQIITATPRKALYDTHNKVLLHLT